MVLAVLIALCACSSGDSDDQTTSPSTTAKLATPTLMTSASPTYTSDALVPPDTPTPTIAPVGQRSTVDRPDDAPGPQIHLVYALPSDGLDRQIDINGTISMSWAAGQRWFGNLTGGRTFRLDTYEGQPDISFFELARPDSDLIASGAYVRDVIELELKRGGFDTPDRIYAVYYDGGSTYACGGGAWPPTLVGTVAAVYLLAEPIGYVVPCTDNVLAADIDSAGYLEHSMIHEIIHTLGFAPRCSPHHTLEGHVSDSPADLMYSGSENWYPDTLDSGNDDYYQHSIEGCLDLADSLYLTP